MITRRHFLLAASAARLSAAEETLVYRAGADGYHTYRIPALLATRTGTLLAFGEGRRNSASDTGDIDVLLKRSTNAGRTWSAAQVIADMGSDTIGNPCPVQDRKTGVIWLPLTSNSGTISEKRIIAGEAPPRRVWFTSSRDDGRTWSPLSEITASVMRPDWAWYATGPGNGIQLRTGRLVIPCDHIVRGGAMHSHAIYSDDHGRTWKIGGISEEKTNECQVAELRDGTLLLNMRSYHGRNRRAVARSRDGGLTWSSIEFDEALIEPVCQASFIRYDRRRLLFSNPADTKRDRMTIRLSPDEGQTWPVAKLLYAGPSAYSSMAVLRDRAIGILYERGERGPYEQIVFARFRAAWLRS